LILLQSNTIFSTNCRAPGAFIMDKIADFFLRQSFKVMMTGFVISTAGVIMYIKTQHKNRVLENAAFTITAIGIGLWLIGRIGIVLQRRKLRKQREQAAKQPAGSET
jgi:hypothetical protein